jgi:hypothetical protein
VIGRFGYGVLKMQPLYRRWTSGEGNVIQWRGSTDAAECGDIGGRWGRGRDFLVDGEWGHSPGRIWSSKVAGVPLAKGRGPGTRTDSGGGVAEPLPRS